MSRRYDPDLETRRAGAPGYTDAYGISYNRPAQAARAAAEIRLAELKALRASGVLHTKFGEREVWFRSDAELRDEIAALEAQINPTRPRNVIVRPTTHKGW